MIDPTAEELIPVGRLPSLIPSSRPGKRLNLATIWRWSTHGVRGARLETVLIGGVRYTSGAAVTRFVEALNATSGTCHPGPTPARRRRQREAAAATCDAAGIA